MSFNHGLWCRPPFFPRGLARSTSDEGDLIALGVGFQQSERQVKEGRTIRRLAAAFFVLALLISGCSTPDRLAIDDFDGESFTSLSESLRHAGCTAIGISQALSGPWPPLTEETVLEQFEMSWLDEWDSGYGEPSMAVEISPGIWLVGADDGVVVGGVDENQKAVMICDDSDTGTT